MTVIKAPRILLPKPEIDLSKWSVIACDQFTSEPEYWQQLSLFVGDHPSTLHMIFPEVYLGKNDDATIRSINNTMRDYESKNILRDLGECFILVDRQTAYQQRRLGLVIAIDLDEYVYAEQTNALIRSTEKTVISRIPPRVKIRQDALYELPHVQLLMNDHDEHIIEGLYEQRSTFEKLYDFQLSMKGGHLKGYRINDTEKVIKLLESQINNGLLFIVGDGNHSLATAKACWEALKTKLPKKDWDIHPSRYAMVELINIHDSGLEFEPIHRVMFDVSPDFQVGLSALSQGTSHCITYNALTGEAPLMLPESAPEAIRLVQDYLDDYIKTHPQASIDYVHGIDSLKSICSKDTRAVGITLPPMNKKDLFDYVASKGVLPRKSFSMGEASEKRYYLECRKIK